MNDDTLSGVPVIEQQPHRADERQRRGEQHDERLDERLELDHHHRDHARRGEREHEQQRAERLLLARVLPADLHADARAAADSRRAPPSRPSSPRRASGSPTSAVIVDHLLLVLAQQLGARLRRLERRERAERHRAPASAGDTTGSAPSSRGSKRTESGARTRTPIDRSSSRTSPAGTPSSAPLTASATCCRRQADPVRLGAD